MEDQGFQEYVQIVADFCSKRENYQRSLGQTASTVVSMYGNDALAKLADEVAETAGVRISVTTLRNYKWVWEKTSVLNLPDDISYRCLQAIAGSKDPEKYAQLVAEGLSSNEIMKLIREEKGLLPKHKTFLCKQCGAPNEV